MDCCHRVASNEMFDAAVARRDLRKFQRKGPDAPTRQLLAGVQARTLPDRPTLLDVGGGVGTIHHVLLDRGFSEATHVDASDAYLAAAADEARRLGHAERVRFHAGTFPPEDASALSSADVVTLNRVVCCDPDYRRLLTAAATHARRVLAFSYPRPRWIVRRVAAAANVLQRLRRKQFRAYVHPPAEMRAVLEMQGLRQTWTGGTWLWAVEVFER
jgi:2-polyprenyl-3-methyl-5-hydroxy-6-metoxy-1,4-benzoquinol methylase